MSPHLNDIWVYLAASPLLGLTATLLAYQCARWVHQRTGYHPLANPVAVAVLLLVALLYLTDTPYPVYFEGAKFVHFLLGPATVALAVPLYLQWHQLARAWLPLSIGLLVGATTAVVSAVGLGWAFGASRETMLSLAPKSVTTPIAMGISEKIGGLPSLTAVLVISTGIIGAMLARPILVSLLRIEAPWIRGFAMGVSAHGIGTAAAFQVSEEMGAFAGLAMGLNGLVSAVAAPVLVTLLFLLQSS